MYEALTILADLSESDREWVFKVGIEEQFNVNASVITEGSTPESVFIVLNGLLAAHVEPMGSEPVGRIGPGEIVGEMSMLEDLPASATLVALEPTRVLSIARSALTEKIDQDAAFAARLYRALARSLTRRLLDRVSYLGSIIAKSNDHAVDTAQDDAWGEIQRPLDELKDLLTKADGDARTTGEIAPESAQQAEKLFNNLCAELTRTIGTGSSAHPHTKETLGARAQRELLPLVLLSESGERWYTKPRGYAGDFLTIQWIYDKQPRGTSRLGPLIDRILLNLPPAQATRNRRGLIGDEIREEVARNSSRVTHVTSFACGPAAEAFDVYEGLEDPTRLKMNLIDIDLQALAFVGDRRDKLSLQHQLNLVQGNPVYLAMGKQKLDVAPQDFIYSMGLIDYFNDKFVVKLLDYVHGMLRPGGRVLLGNAHKRNPIQAFQDYVLGWRLVHRDEADMNRLLRASAFGQECTRTLFEDAGIHFFSECVKT
jgi:extracellular factor (EF) 3-hydroxypalmitic acid methyl ester biosynthesis protein